MRLALCERLTASFTLLRPTLANALYRHWPKGEKLIADALGVTPEQIWPCRYR
ncbi:hypothetical protein BVD23_22360 [Salmonella enterica]|nr:hypothetical protein [Salmonella enterica]ECJ5920676.1 transcriptional regulator [Salmonella enterica subsp. salamae]HCM1832185.1 helix-turn-helix domain-containing protein [Salmonella enterica subsp. salamae serovar 48:z81:z39]HCM1884866.1 helix-turn-helix domain-containing protein [Salmonella enterica subsp. salamae serovar 60:z10:z39]EAN4947426.1 hypothetical protein [Salmonella enterica]